MRLPTTSDRILINGRTGSGKTQFAVWLLSQYDLQEQIWIVLNHKRTKLINAIPHATFCDVDFRPEKPGVYIYQPLPSQKIEVENLLWWIWSKSNVGLYVDEGYMVDRYSDAFAALFTQGREKNIPMITLSQRPMWVCPFAISESEFFTIFHLINKKDRQRINEFVPLDLEAIIGPKAEEENKLPRFHSLYYDVQENNISILSPVPDVTDILKIFDKKLAPEAIEKANKKIQSVSKYSLI